MEIGNNGINSVRDESGLTFPQNLEQMEAVLQTGIYLLPHHLGTILVHMVHNGGHENGFDLVESAATWLDIVAHEKFEEDHVPIRDDYPGIDVNHLDDVRHSYNQDVTGDSLAIEDASNLFLRYFIDANDFTVGIDNSRDPICHSINIGATGNHCHLHWLASTSETLGLSRTVHSDSAIVLNMLQWIAFARQVDAHERVLKRIPFLRSIRDGLVQVNTVQASAHGTLFVLPEVQFSKEFFNTSPKELERINFKFLSTIPTLEEVVADYALSRPAQIANGIQGTMNLNNFNDFL